MKISAMKRYGYQLACLRRAESVTAIAADGKRDRHDHDYERTRCTCPLRRHTVTRQVTWHNTQQTCHRRSTSEPQNRDRAEVIDGAEDVSEKCVSEICDGAAVCLAAFRKLLCRDQHRRHTAATDQQDAHD